MIEGTAEPTTVIYTFTQEDMLQKLPPKSAAAAPLRRSSGLGWIIIVSILIWLIYFLILEVINPWRPPPEAVVKTWPWTVGLFLLTVGSLWYFAKNFLKNHYAKLAKAQALGPLPLKVTATLEAEGFRIETVSGVSLVYWRNMYAVAESEKYIFLVENLMKVYPIPRTAFRSPADAEAFRAEANRRMREAGGGRTVADEPPRASK